MRAPTPRVPESICHRNDLWVEYPPGPDRCGQIRGLRQVRRPTSDTSGLDIHRRTVAGVHAGVLLKY